MRRLLALILLLFCVPLFGVLFILVKLSSAGPFLFHQKRIGKNKKPFYILKIRSMYKGAEYDQQKLRNKNEAHGPVFKIRNDPRFTPLGKWLTRTGLDELPQLINIIKGEMDFVGPRPLPPNESQKIPEKYSARFSILPGITSSWIISGAHCLPFSTWMKLDCAYVANKSAVLDLSIMIKTVLLIYRSFFVR